MKLLLLGALGLGLGCPPTNAPARKLHTSVQPRTARPRT